MKDLHVALVHPEIHWNTGNAGRSCLAFGAQLHLVEPLGFSLDDREVRRAGLDYWKEVQPVIHASFADLETQIPALGSPWFLSPDGERTLPELELTRPTLFLLGSETGGFPRSIRDQYRNRLVRIGQRDQSVRSLNLSTTAAIAMYEFRRRFPT